MSEQLYVALTETGEYLKRYTVETHVGTKVRFDNVSLNNADVLPKHIWRRAKPPKCTLLPATVVRVVTLQVGVGYD